MTAPELVCEPIDTRRPFKGQDQDIPGRVAAVISVLSIVVSLTTIAVWGMIAVAHAGDAYLVTHVSGVRMVQARYLDHGVLYPPLYDGHHYGGTRMMPLSIVLHAAAARLTGEYLTSGRLLTFLTLMALVSVVFALLRRRRCPPAAAAILAVSLLITEPGYHAGFSLLLADALSVLLQLGAVSTLVSGAARSRTLAAAALSALAFMTKLSAFWAPMASVLWLAITSPKRLVLFASAYALLVIVLTGAVSLASEGRFFENMFGLSLAGIDGPAAALHAPTHLLRILFFNTPALWAVAPVAVLAVGIRLRRRELSITDIGLICHLPLLLVVFADIGADANHLLDLAVLTVLAIGRAASYRSPTLDESPVAARECRPLRLTVIQGGVTLLALWIAVTHLVIRVPDVQGAVAAFRTGASHAHRPLERWIRVEDAILSEDPYVPVALGQTPVIADPFMLPRIGKRHPEAIDALVRRIEAREFDVIILLAPLERSWWWERFHFGSGVITAVDRAYTFSRGAEGYYLYTPRRD